MANQSCPAVPGTARNYRLTALIIAGALFMEQLDATVLTTALPGMAADFGVSVLHMSVALTSYLIALAVFIPASGFVADRFGSRNVFAAAMVLFALGSAACALTTSLPMLVAARLVQGLGGAMMMPVGRLVLLQSVEKRDFVAAMAWMTVPGLLGPMVGPVVGGFFTTYLSWHWAFYINLPMAAVGVIAAFSVIEDVRSPAPGRFDGIGFVLSGAALASLVFGLETLSRRTGSDLLAASLVMAGIGFGIAYAVHARHHVRPILDLTLLKVSTYAASVYGGSLTRIAGGALPFLLPLMMQTGFGMSAAESGLITFAAAGGSFAMKIVARPILRRFGFRSTMVWNAVLSALLIALIGAFRPGWPLPVLYLVLIAAGFFQSLQFTACNTVAYTDLPRARMSAATSLYTTIQQMVLSLGVCTATGVLAAAVALDGRTAEQLVPADFTAAFVAVAAFAMAGTLFYARMPADAGADMSGHRPKQKRRA
ncbi:MFS transporter [Pseudoxanthobacter sp.]|uniref:MFS transporter n=1 Tax=Pseudoxanthobacter sp. TaxID=1925742 RepID=UPI002FE20324